MQAKNPIEQILDENNLDNIFLYDAENKPIEFEQVAVIPHDDSDLLYAILIPITPMQGVQEGEGVLFAIDEIKGSLDIVSDEETIDKVFTIYQQLLQEGE
ncbi:MAG: DUF1292 domain-containing protein [Clostridia bacterium]|nr:DUF1292 domain-containing protein [Clostridia bacterium]